MGAHVSMAELFGALLPRGCPSGWLAMLRAYFDDSGTHDSSQIVLVGGVCGTEWQLTALDSAWQKHLDRPLCGHKPSLSRFHAAQCHDSRGEFAGWSRTETDYYVHQLGTAIIDSGVGAYGIACVRGDYDAIIKGDVRAIFGNPEQMCIRNCFVRAIRWAERTTFDPQMTFIFDNRPDSIQADAQIVSHAFEHGRLPSQLPNIVGTAFLSSTKIRPLQAADLIAWELNQFAHEIVFAGARAPSREELRRLMSNMYFDAQIARGETIQKIVDHIGQQDQDPGPSDPSEKPRS